MSEVARLAREWIGTPFCHRAATKGAGCDCLGLVRGLRREITGAEPEAVPDYAAGWFEIDAGERLWHALRQQLVEVPRDYSLAEGHVLLFRMHESAAARHLGILSQLGRNGDRRFIHAYECHGVIESPLSAPWIRRVVARFQLA